MEPEITGYYCLCEELLSALNIEENSQIKTDNAEVMTVLLTAAAFIRFFHRLCACNISDASGNL